MRTRLPLVALSAAALLLTAPGVRAQDTGSAAWSGSSLTHALLLGCRGRARQRVLHAQPVSHDHDHHLHIGQRARPTAPCPSTTGSSGRTPMSYATDLSFGCNGVYTVTAVAATTNDSALTPHDEAIS